MSLIAVVDVETTGLRANGADRIVEIGAVVMDSNGMILREFESLVNPDRDVGLTSLHGITASDVATAPRFGDVAGHLLETLRGSVALGNHNATFDRLFLANEFARIDSVFPTCRILCTLQLVGGGSLSACCTDFDIDFDGEAHRALHDARAAARLLSKILSDDPVLASEVYSLTPIAWPTVPKTNTPPLTRDSSRQRQAQPPTYLASLIQRVNSLHPFEDDDACALAYTDLLDRALADRHVSEAEGDCLADTAYQCGLNGERIMDLHHDYLQRLVSTALMDQIVTDAERRDLCIVGRLLGVTQVCLDDMLDKNICAKSQESHATSAISYSIGPENMAGKRVCFTGECRCRVGGNLITREVAEELSTRFGLIVDRSVTKKLELLVVSDPRTQSGKAQKARKYAIPIMDEFVFWQTLGVGVD